MNAERGYMDSKDYNEDLEYLYSELLRHPLFLEDEKKKRNFEELYLSVKEKELEYDSFLDTATELTLFFQDGHTNIELPYTSQDRCVRLRCCWNEADCRELVLTECYEDIPEHAQILKVEGMTVPELILLFADRIPHENIYLVKSRMIRYPYQNYHVFSEMNLKKMFGGKENYRITFLVDGEIVNKEIPLVSYDGFLDFVSDDEFLTYKVMDDVVILHLKQCIYNERYKQILRELAQICNEQDIRTFVLDLSSNMGGDSSVIDEFIQYTRVKNYRRYEMIDYSSGKAVKRTSREEQVGNLQQEWLFPEDIRCIVSHNTFSSARTFAVTLKDNGIARIYGSETGGRPSSYGLPRRMHLPKTNIRFRVSRCRFLRPDADRDDEITLRPETK